MLMDIKCSTVTSIELELSFDNGFKKHCIVSKGDIVWMIFNYNGCRKEVEGKVLKITANGSDPKAWVILIDASEDFGATQYRVCPLNILDIDVIKKRDAIRFIESPSNYSNIASMRIVEGRLQYTQDGINWYPVRIDMRDIIKDESYGPIINDGTVGAPVNHNPGCHCAPGGDIPTDGIYEEEGN